MHGHTLKLDAGLCGNNYTVITVTVCIIIYYTSPHNNNNLLAVAYPASLSRCADRPLFDSLYIIYMSWDINGKTYIKELRSNSYSYNICKACIILIIIF